MGRFELRGFRTLVTASTRGIGRGVAEVLLEEGARVFISGRSKESVERALAELRPLGEVYGYPADITVREQAEDLVENACEYLGGLDGLVYVTGPPRPGTFSELDLNDWEFGVKLLTMSAIWITRKALPCIEKSERGSLVYVTSTAVREPIPNLALSNVLRVSVHGLVKTLSRELGPKGIRVNAVAPGYVVTDRTTQLARDISARTGKSVEEVFSEWSSEVPLRRLGTPREVGYVVAFLLSPLSSYVSGVVVPVDGGRTRSL
ncbi:MAG: SDR family oxidoreductase [Sulfolobales archaeon]|nr:SDR family oxidoreductase [Sulfolobales archaeon]MDW8082813.1 SDR family oxidoreductase [Sulfolobales archaeon]